MSKDIWHTADITPESCRILICKTNKGQNYTAIIPSPQEWNTIILPEFYNLGDIDNAERIEQYAYLDDLLALETELDRTREELYKANAELDYIKEQVKKSNAFIHARIKVAADQIARGIIDQVKIIKEKKDVK